MSTVARLVCCLQRSDETDSEAVSAAAACSRLNSALTNSIMEFILHDDTVDIDVLRRSLHHQVSNKTVSCYISLSLVRWCHPLFSLQYIYYLIFSAELAVPDPFVVSGAFCPATFRHNRC